LKERGAFASPRRLPLSVEFAASAPPRLEEAVFCLLTGILVRDDGVAIIALTAMAMNIAGSTGDLVAAWKVRQLGGGTVFEDTADGFNWYRSSRPNL